MDHPGIDKFMVLGFCIAGPFIWNLISGRQIGSLRQPAQPVGFRSELPNSLYESQTTGWAEPLVKRRSDITHVRRPTSS